MLKIDLGHTDHSGIPRSYRTLCGIEICRRVIISAHRRRRRISVSFVVLSGPCCGPATVMLGAISITRGNKTES